MKMAKIFPTNIYLLLILEDVGNIFPNRGIVQLVERSIHIAQVVGSNPISGLYKILIFIQKKFKKI
jgi:hypothetical protein